MPHIPTEPERLTGVRIRIEHSRTLREGWGYSTTVELTGHLDGSDIFLRDLEALLARARVLGVQERDTRNAMDPVSVK